MMFKLRLSLGTIIAKFLVLRYGLKVNCLLTRHPLVWINPNLKDCIQLARLREHGFQVSAMQSLSISAKTKVHLISGHPLTTLSSDSKKWPDHLNLHSRYKFSFLLDKVIELAEKDLLEI